MKVDGSTGAMPLVAALAKAYEAKTPSLRIEIGTGLGTKARIEALNAGSIDLAVASHGLKIDDLVKQGMNVDEIARTPVVFGVNSSVPLSNLSQAQVCAIYSGALTNWQAAGGPDLAIAARTRPDNEVDAEVVRDGIECLKALKMPEAVKVMQRGGDMAKELATTTGAIGMTTTTVVEQSGDKIKALSLDGIAPTEANVTAEKYRLVREVFLVAESLDGKSRELTRVLLDGMGRRHRCDSSQDDHRRVIMGDLRLPRSHLSDRRRPQVCPAHRLEQRLGCRSFGDRHQDHEWRLRLDGDELPWRELPNRRVTEFGLLP
jgi:phosphate transport system substrate-binding protein